jgi:hypothetical protein
MLHSHKLYKAILKALTPATNYQLLCANCHKIKTVECSDHLNHRKFGKSTRPGKPRTEWSKWKVWLKCAHCTELFLCKALTHSTAKYCSRLCQNRYQSQVLRHWEKSYIPGVYTFHEKNPSTTTAG